VTEPTQPALERYDDSWSSALAIVAHPDDVEYGVAGAVARWTSLGKQVGYCLATRGEAGIDSLPPEEAGPLREAEQRAAASIVGVEDVEFLGYPDGVIEYGLPLRRDVARAIRRRKPDVVVIINHRDFWAPGRPNQADHVAVGRAVIDGARDAGNRWVFRELLDDGLPPWQVRHVLSAGGDAVTHGVDISEHFDKGVASLRAHAAYLAALGENPLADPEEFLESVARATGARLGCVFGAAFEVVAV
jgi:LmbE family N-acetylglucosaminyl deacetylase